MLKLVTYLDDELPLKGISIHPQTEKGSERNWTQADCNGSGPTSAQLQIFWGSGHHRLTYPYRHSESAIALIPMYNSRGGIDRLRRLKPNLDQSCRQTQKVTPCRSAGFCSSLVDPRYPQGPL